ncbi:MAG: YaiO family outer membrane beta-barrel protein, partial [Ignavibacteria bacterium]|nr:YaiO family outer membrane beta-barrel protein [Ignavibacteria bacterium]
MKASSIKLTGIFLTIFSVFLVYPAYAQTRNSEDTTSLEPLLNQARQLAYNKERAKARKICFQILNRDSTYWDAAVLIGRTYIWDSKYDSSRVVLNRIIVNKPGYYDAFDAIIDNELMDDNYTTAIKLADEALLYHPDDESFLYKKARALNKLGKTKESSALLSRILQINSANKEAPKLLLDIKRAGRVNKFTMTYSTDMFNGSTPWTFASASIGRKTTHFGSIILRYNYANRFGNNGHQAEIDAYPAICKGIYVYFNAGVSNKKNFPFSRLSIEPYFKLPKSFEASIGVR